MKDLLKQAFKAGRDFGYAMGNGKPTYGLTFDEWYADQVKNCTIPDVVGRSEQYYCELFAFGRQDKRCFKQCEGCEWMEGKQ